MLHKLLKLANHLDSRGFFDEADVIDGILREASMSPTEYAKYYGREMEPERRKEWNKEQMEREEQVIPLPADKDDVDLDALKPESDKFNHDNMTKNQLEFLRLFNKIALGLKSFNYWGLVVLYSDLYKGGPNARWVGLLTDQEHDNLMDRIVEQAKKWKIKYDPKDFPA
jgi:hypothetical protein